MFICIRGILLILLALTHKASTAQELVINEMMSSNQSFIFDEDGDDSDWIEIYNHSDLDINLDGYFLSDKSDNIYRWAFPDTIIPSKTFLLVFASGKDRAVPGNELHTNFSIKSDGEELFLSYMGTLVHSVPEIPLIANTSYGLETDGNLPFVVYLSPTPGRSNNASQVLCALAFSKPGGIYKDSFTLSVSCEPEAYAIYYTLDGTMPDANATRYSGAFEMSKELCSPVNINQIQVSPHNLHKPPPVNSLPKAIVIRAAAFDVLGNRISDVVTNSYFIKELGIDHKELPIVSVCAEHDALFDHESGILVPGVHWNPNDPDWTGNYYQQGRDWERKVSVEFYEPEGNIGFKQTAGLRTHGGNSRRHPQKGLRLYARSDYGQSRFDHPLFKDKEIPSYKRLVLKPLSSSWSEAGIEDYLSNKMALTTEIDAIATRPAILYLNGEYWGIYFLQERIDARFIEDNYGIDKDSIDMIFNWYGATTSGNNTDFLALYDFVETNDLSLPHNYQTISDWMDIENFIDYQIFEIFIANYDWPASNMKCWRNKKPGSKWRWIFFDGDAALQKPDFNSFKHAMSEGNDDWPTNAISTLFFRKLLRNESFYDQFFSRMEFLLNHQLHDSVSSAYYQNILTDINNDIFNQIERFSFPGNYKKWADNVVSCKEFLAYRKCEILKQSKKLFVQPLSIDGCYQARHSVEALSVFPNPNNGLFTLSFHSSETYPGSIIVCNLSGKTIASFNRVFTAGDNSILLNLQDIDTGFYIVSLQNRDNFYSTKVMILP